MAADKQVSKLGALLLATMTPGGDRAYVCGWSEGLAKALLSIIPFWNAYDALYMLGNAALGSKSLAGYCKHDAVWEPESIKHAQIAAIIMLVLGFLVVFGGSVGGYHWHIRRQEARRRHRNGL